MKKILNLFSLILPCQEFTISKKWVLGMCLVFACAFIPRMAYLKAIPNDRLTATDSVAYEQLAQTIKNNTPYNSSAVGGPGGFPADLNRPPGYPFFLTIINNGDTASRYKAALAQVILGSLFASILFLLIGRLFSYRVGIITALLYAIDWVSIIHTPIIMADVIYTFPLTLSVLCLAFYIRDKNSSLWLPLLTGLLLGISALIKPAAQLLPVGFILVILFIPKKRLGLLFLITYFALTIPWMTRNYVKHGVFTLSEIGTSSLYFYNAQGVFEYDSAFNIDTGNLENRVDKLSDEWNAKPLSPNERAKAMQEESWNIITDHFGTFLIQSTVGFTRTCIGTGKKTVLMALSKESEGSNLFLVIIPLAQIIFCWLLAAFGIIACLMFKTVPKKYLILFALVIFLSLLPSASPVGYSRYRTHSAPIILLLSSIGIVQAFDTLQRKNRERYFKKSEDVSNA